MIGSQICDILFCMNPDHYATIAGLLLFDVMPRHVSTILLLLRHGLSGMCH